MPKHDISTSKPTRRRMARHTTATRPTLALILSQARESLQERLALRPTTTPRSAMTRLELLELPQKKTFGEVYKLWLDAHKLQVKPSTIESQSAIAKNHILPYFGNDDISKIKPIKYQQWVINLAKSYAAYKIVISIFNQIYGYGVSLGACSKLNNPNLVASIPSVSL
ncbi:N-terminal phage integrase SAM-like domain-containing protein [Lactobacillus delbrueckii subsp. bulgaricus]|nr:hypothetical protein [Lactobacillus delbrueckii subsp. bulgaricus]